MTNQSDGNHATDATEPAVLAGALAVEAALASEGREVLRVWVDRDTDHRKLEPLRRAAQLRRLTLESSGADTLDALAGEGKHGGVVAEVGPRRFVPLDSIFQSVRRDGRRGKTPAFVAMLDGIEDPFNFGQSVRALYAAGCTGIIVRPRNWTTAAAVIARASAGATERIEMAVAEGPEEAAEAAQRHEVMVVATGQSDDAVPYTLVDFTGPTLLMIGGERRGLRRSFLAECEQVVTIPYGPGVAFPAALGTVAACAVLGFEVARQRSVQS